MRGVLIVLGAVVAFALGGGFWLSQHPAFDSPPWTDLEATIREVRGAPAH